MVGVFVGDEDSVEGFGGYIRGQPFKRFLTTQARINEDSRAASGDERRIAGARACQDGEGNDSGDASLEDDNRGGASRARIKTGRQISS